MHLELLIRQLSHRYGAARRAFTVGVTEEAARRTLGARPTIAWHADHVAGAVASVAHAVLGHPQIDEATLDPTYRALQGRLWERFDHVLDGLKALDPGALELPPAIEIHPAFRASLTTRGAFLEGHVFHVAYHLGSVAVLRAEFGLDDLSSDAAPSDQTRA